jgi:hypothetical protein
MLSVRGGQLLAPGNSRRGAIEEPKNSPTKRLLPSEDSSPIHRWLLGCKSEDILVHLYDVSLSF